MCIINYKFKDNIIYCEKCGKSKFIECNHILEDYDRTKITDKISNYIKGYEIIKQCKKCGILITFAY